MKRNLSSYASAFLTLSLVVACGGEDGSTGLVAAGGSAGSAGAGGGSGKAGTGGAAGVSGKAGAAGQSTGGTSSGGAAGNPSGGAGGQAAGAAGSGTAGSGTAGSGTAGSGTAGSGTAGSGTAGNGTAGNGTAGSGTAGSGTAGNGTAGNGTAGSGTAGSGTAGNGTAGAAGDGGSGAAGNGTAGSGTAGSGTAGAAGAASGCTGTDTACATASGADGLCRNSVCQACNEPADDAACATAYNAGDRCLAGSCGTCDAVGSTYFVDPINGSDAIGNGSGQASGAASARCAFKTVTAAIKAIGSNPAGATLIIAVAGPSTLDTSEAYPLRVPPKTTVTASGGDVSVKITTNARAFELTADGASLDGTSFLIDIDASKQLGATTSGIFVGSGSTDASIIRHVRVSETTGAGIAVAGNGRVTIQAGVIVRKNGRGNNARAGVAVSDIGFATFDAPAGSDPILIEEAGVGIAVTGTGAIKIAAVPDTTAADKGTLVVQKNIGPGVAITQSTGAAGGLLPLNDIAGLVSYGNGTGNNGGSGLRSSFRSNLKLRGSVLLANKNHGVHLVTSDGAGPLSVDLGTAGDAGRNIVQRANAQGNVNLGVGICLSPGAATNLTVPARGNVFGTVDCAVTAGTLSKANNGQNACSQIRDTGVDNPGATNTIDVAICK